MPRECRECQQGGCVWIDGEGWVGRWRKVVGDGWWWRRAGEAGASAFAAWYERSGGIGVACFCVCVGCERAEGGETGRVKRGVGEELRGKWGESGGLLGGGRLCGSVSVGWGVV